ncbi:MAG: ArsR/SmtB family transcription factor [Candidatus Competibacterales bacterium]
MARSTPAASALTEGVPPGPDDGERLAELAKALGHPARIEIVQTLLRRRRCVGCDLVEEIGLAQSTTSEHLRILKAAGIVIGELERPYMCYTLNPSALQPLRRWLAIIAHQPTHPLEQNSESP